MRVAIRRLDRFKGLHYGEKDEGEGRRFEREGLTLQSTYAIHGSRSEILCLGPYWETEMRSGG